VRHGFLATWWYSQREVVGRAVAAAARGAIIGKKQAGRIIELGLQHWLNEGSWPKKQARWNVGLRSIFVDRPAIGGSELVHI